jgi:hypothetical protein
MIAYRCHSRSRRGLWKFSLPVGSQIEIAANLAE